MKKKTKAEIAQRARGPGQPTTYRPEYCELLVKHCKGGNSFESFGAVVGCSKQTLYNWEEAHPEFFDARKQGEPLLIKFYEDLGLRMAAGLLVRVKSEKARLDGEGNPIFDSKGMPVMDREYEPANPGQSAFIFLTKNLLGWRDRKDIELSGKDGGPVEFSGLSDEELEEKISALVAEAVKTRKSGPKR